MKRNTMTINHYHAAPRWYQAHVKELHRLGELINQETPSEKKLHGCSPDQREELVRKAELERRQLEWQWTASVMKSATTAANQARRAFDEQGARFEARERAEARG